MAPCGIFNHRAGDPKDLLKAEHRAPDNQEEPVVHNGNNDDESILQARESPAQSTQVPVARMPGAVLPKKQAASKSTNSQGPQTPRLPPCGLDSCSRRWTRLDARLPMINRSCRPKCPFGLPRSSRKELMRLHLPLLLAMRARSLVSLASARSSLLRSVASKHCML